MMEKMCRERKREEANNNLLCKDKIFEGDFFTKYMENEIFIYTTII